MNGTSEELLVQRVGGAGRVTLNRPGSLNALSLGMLQGMRGVLREWRADPGLSLVMLDGEGGRAFCAGGDIRAMYPRRESQDDFADTFFREEYLLDAEVARFPKPVVAFMHGIVMGGGVGISAHRPHRIVTDSTVMAMPEVGIGLVPDVGTTWLLSRLPGEIGTFLALTGSRIGAADAIAFGLADSLVPQADFEPLRAALTAIAGPDAERQIQETIARFSQAPGQSGLLGQRDAIDRTFRFDEVERIMAALAEEDTEWARAVAATMASKSPTSLKVTLAALRKARSLPNMEACLQLEYRIVWHILRGHDFYEGVRAAVVDKDQRPQWLPPTLAEVTPEMVSRYFEGLGSAELTF